MNRDTILKTNKTLDFYIKPDEKVLVFDHVHSKSYFISNGAYCILKEINGRRTVQDIIDLFHNKYSDDKIVTLLEQFINMKICSDKLEFDYFSLMQEFKSSGRLIFWKNPESIIFINKRILRDSFRLIMLLSTLLFIGEIPFFWRYIYKHSFSLDSACIIPAFLIFTICLFLHEFSHSVFAKSYGANVCEIGLQVLKDYPFVKFYTDIAGISYIRKKRHLLLLHSAGVMSSFFLLQFSWLFIWNNDIILNKIGMLIIIIVMMSVIIDLLPIKGTDGRKIINVLLSECKK